MAMQILSRLPPQSLMRFKAVHKSWYTMINNLKFISKHPSISMHNHSSTCVLYKLSTPKNDTTNDNDEKETVFSLLTLSNVDYDDPKEHFVHYVAIGNESNDIMKDLESVWFIGHCDGSICLADSSNNVILWNPAIREFKLLYPDQVMTCFGIGYDPKSQGYKVVNIPKPGEEEYGDGHLLNNPPIVQVYNLGSNSWREIMTGTLETETTNMWPEEFDIYFKGFCYWRGREQMKEFDNFCDRNEEEYVRQVIISFDTVDEHRLWYIPRLFTSIEGDGRLDGVAKGSWIKQFIFGTAVGFEKPLQFWNQEEILLVSCNINTGEIKHLMDFDHFLN